VALERKLAAAEATQLQLETRLHVESTNAKQRSSDSNMITAFSLRERREKKTARRRQSE
jgi:hypothetical protein